MKKTMILVYLCLTAMVVSAANITIPNLELISRGYMESSLFKMKTWGTMDMLIGGGYKFGGRVVLTYESDNLSYSSLTLDQYDATTDGIYDYLDHKTSLVFKSASITSRNLFGLPFDLTYFTGEQRRFCDGSVFPEYFGTNTIASQYTGYMYFPSGVQYEGIHAVSGSGLQLTLSGLSDWMFADLYVYQDAYIGRGYYSSDLYFAMNTSKVKLEAFAGASFPMSTYGIYRSGLFLFYEASEGTEFLSQIGLPRWDPANDPFSINLFYFLFEPRVRFGLFQINLTLFWHPQYYLNTPTNEVPTANVNANFFFGDIEQYPVSGGIETGFTFNSTSSDQLQVTLSPYFSIVSSGVIWDFKVKGKLFPFSLDDLAEAYIGLKAVF